MNKTLTEKMIDIAFDYYSKAMIRLGENNHYDSFLEAIAKKRLPIEQMISRYGIYEVALISYVVAYDKTNISKLRAVKNFYIDCGFTDDHKSVEASFTIISRFWKFRLNINPKK